MLTPEQLASLTENSTVLKLWRQLETDILTDMARRIGKTDFGTVTETAIWQAYRLEQSRLFRSTVVAKLARLTGKSRKAVKDLLQQAGTYTLLNDDAVYRGAGRNPPPLNESAALLNLLNAGASQTSGTMLNLTATTADTASRQFENALDRAWMQVSSGAFDYRSAIRRTIGTLSAQGLRCIEYTHTGHIDTLETAVRRAVLTGVNQTCAKLQVERMNQMGCEFVEVTAHAGARPNHAEWQGQVFHRGGSVRYQGKSYPDFESSTGYGTGEGLCGWNCRHNFYPFFPGISEPLYTPKRLAALNARDVEWDGKMLTRYELEQKQRAAERNVRKYRRRSLMEAAAGEIDPKTAVKIKEWQAKVRKLERVTDHPAADRVMVHGYGRSQAAKVTGLYHRTSIDSSRVARYSYEQYQLMLKNAKKYNAQQCNGSLPITGIPNSISELVNQDGTIRQRRVYGNDKKALIDYDTSDHKKPKYHPMGAHKHDLDYDLKNPHGSALLLSEFDLKYNKDIIQKGVNYHPERVKKDN